MQMHSNARYFDGHRDIKRRIRVEREGSLPIVTNGYDINERLFFEPFRKTALTYAAQINEPFVVNTIEGDNQVGQAGDFLVVGLAGEMYPVAHDIFLNTYERADIDG